MKYPDPVLSSFPFSPLENPMRTKLTNGKWFEPRSLSRLRGLIVRVRVVPRRTVVGDIDRRFDNLSGSHIRVMTLMMTSAQVVETSVNVTNNSPSRDYSHPDDQTTQKLTKFKAPAGTLKYSKLRLHKQ